MITPPSTAAELVAVRQDATTAPLLLPPCFPCPNCHRCAMHVCDCVSEYSEAEIAAFDPEASIRDWNPEDDLKNYRFDY